MSHTAQQQGRRTEFSAVEVARIAEESPDVLFEVELRPTPRVRYLSRAVEPLFGFRRSVLLGDPRRLLALVSDDDAAGLRALAEPGAWRGVPIVIRWRCRSGATIALSVRGTVGRDGDAIVVRGVARELGPDTTEHHDRAALLDAAVIAANEGAGPAEALGQALELLCRALGRTFAAIHLLTPGGELQTRAVHNADPRDRRLWHLQRRTEGVHPFNESLVGTVASANRAMTISDVRSDVRFQRGWGTDDLGVAGWVAFPVRADDKVVGVVELFSRDPGAVDDDVLDVLEEIGGHLGRAIDRQQTEEHLHEIDRAKTMFVARAAHELRNPVGALGVLISTLLAKSDVLAEDDRHTLLHNAERSLDRLRALVRRLLDLADLESGGARMAMGVLDAGTVVRAAIDDLPPVIRRQIKRSIEDGHLVDGDELALTQIVVNLVTNAWHYGGPHIRVVVRGEESVVRILVEDDGPGVPPELVSSLFEPFVRGRADRDEPGLGLGLAICRRLAEACGWVLLHESVEPNGARFALTLRRSVR